MPSSQTHPQQQQSQDPILPYSVSPSRRNSYINSLSTSQLAHLQCGEFGILPALASHSLLFKQLAANSWTGVPQWLNLVFWFIALAGGIVALIAYSLKVWRYPRVVKWEMLHPLRHNDYYLILIGLFLMTLAYPAHYFGQPKLTPIWFILTILQILLSYYVYGDRLAQTDNPHDPDASPSYGEYVAGGGGWDGGRRAGGGREEGGGRRAGVERRRGGRGAGEKREHADWQCFLVNVYPSYLFTLVGWFLSTSLGADANQPELSLWMFAIGSFYYLLLYISLYQNLGRARKSMSESKTGPLLFLIMAPSAVAAVAWSKLTVDYDALKGQGTDAFGVVGRFFFCNSVVQVVLVARTVKSLVVSRQAAFPWWASVFPTVAVALAFIEYYKVTHTNVVRGFLWLFCGIAWFTLLFVITKILHSMFFGKLVADPMLDKELESVQVHSGRDRNRTGTSSDGREDMRERRNEEDLTLTRGRGEHPVAPQRDACLNTVGSEGSS
ncbi:hypothetical protein HDV00_007259 [Rhizophlyctis rosea]|nr:hypothetical protein HDV00_007259 [Rhizophlyctis rosea]